LPAIRKKRTYLIALLYISAARIRETTRYGGLVTLCFSFGTVPSIFAKPY
jgi:hypothetical protein